MEKITAKTFLYYSATKDGKFEKLTDITSYPKLFTNPEKLDISDLSSQQKKYTEGMIDHEDLNFGFNYTKARYDDLKAKEEVEGYYQLRFGANGQYGAWQWSGTHRASVDAGEVGGVRKGTLTCYPETEIESVTITV